MPGKVIDVIEDGRKVVLDYFGERRKVRNDFYQLSVGDYAYAQGGFVVQKVPPDEAAEALAVWKDYLDALESIDMRLAEKGGSLRKRANFVRREATGNSACVHGIIEFSNYCRNDCHYCGLRVSNKSVERYRMSEEEIVEAAGYAIENLGFRALVLQSGEDTYYDGEKLSAIVSAIMRKHPVLIVVSIGEMDYEVYEKLYAAGARGALLRFETSNGDLYKKYRPGHTLDERLGLIRRLKNDGWIIMSGFILGLPGATLSDIASDIKLSYSLGVEMLSFGPLVPHPDTPLASATPPSFDETLDTIARARLMYPDMRILVTTAAETIGRAELSDDVEPIKAALGSGANSVMINLTPRKYSRLYSIYPGRDSDTETIADEHIFFENKIRKVVSVLRSLGRAPTDLGTP